MNDSLSPAESPNIDRTILSANQLSIYGAVSSWCESKSAIIIESAGFMRRVSVGMRHTTIQDVNDGFGDRAVLEVKTISHLDDHGIEIFIPSTSGDSTNSWVVKSRGQNHHVDHLRYNDPTGASRKLMQNSRLLNRDLSAVNLKITFLFTKGSGLTSLPMDTATTQIL